MSAVLLYIDVDAAQAAVVAGLRHRNIDVVTAIELGMQLATDDEHLDYATAESRSLYSLNAGDFCRIHAERLAAGIDHFGIIVIPRQRYSIGEKIRRLERLVATITAEDMATDWRSCDECASRLADAHRPSRSIAYRGSARRQCANVFARVAFAALCAAGG